MSFAIVNHAGQLPGFSIARRPRLPKFFASVQGSWREILKIRLCLLLVLLCAITAAAQTKVPRGKPVLLDGHVDKSEWQDAAVIHLDDFARVYIKESGDFVWLALELLKDKNGTLDLYLSTEDGTIYDLHSSAKLGERKLSGAAWPEEWTWWNNEGWTSNVSRLDSWDKRRFLEEPSREFQIAKARFPGKKWKLMFEIMTPAEPQWKTTRFPEKALTTDAKDWYVVSFR